MTTMPMLIQPHQQPAGTACLELFPPSKMALNSMKTNKNHKIFPFSSPTITAHKNPPTGHALILEIIFDADDVNSAGSNQTNGEEEGDEDDDNQGDSDEEDDADSDSDTSSHHGGPLSDGDSEEDEEEEDEEDDDSEESDEDDDCGVEFDEDFVNDFDGDLEIEFGHESEEDPLVIEFEDVNSPPSSPKEPVPPENTVPFWFMNEEPDQIRTILESYALTLDLETQRKACIRSPSPFIGRVKRTPIKPAESDTDKSFKTLDRVEVYLRELYPLGTKLPLSREAWVLTTWDDDGIPIHSSEMSKSTKKSMQKRAQGAQSSTLYCAPIFRTKDDYQYTVSPQEHSLMYASNSSTNASISRISPFLPEHCRTISFSLD